MKISIVIPMYGCRAAVEELYNTLVASVSTITSDFEIIMVNDNCPQNSWEIIEKLCHKDERVKGIEMARNFGQMKAILAGLDYATGDWAVVMDCDLQDRPEEIPNLYAKAMEGYDAVFARRAERKDSPIKVFISNVFYKVYEFATDAPYDGAICNFSIIKRNVVDAYCSMREQNRSYVMYINWLGFRRTAIDVQHDERFEGKSSYNMKKRIDMAFDILTSQSDKILRLTIKLGMLMAFLSLLVIIICVIRYFATDVAMGWTSIIATICLVGGILTIVMGIVGIYVGNTFMQVKERPLYVVRQILNNSKEEPYE